MSVKPPSLARTPEPPYYAVIVTSQRTEGDLGYGHMAERMIESELSPGGPPVFILHGL